MIVLDHNIPKDQAQQLRRRRVHFRQIGFEVGRPEWDDQQEILRFLHATKQITFFTRDLGFFRAPLRHANYCLGKGLGKGVRNLFLRCACRLPILCLRPFLPNRKAAPRTAIENLKSLNNFPRPHKHHRGNRQAERLGGL